MKHISYEGFNEKVITFNCTNEVTAGAPVRFSDDDTVTVSGEGEEFIGVALSARDGLAAVQLCGTVELPFAGTQPVCGFNLLFAGEDGAIAVCDDDGDTAARRLLVLAVDTVNETCVVLL